MTSSSSSFLFSLSAAAPAPAPAPAAAAAGGGGGGGVERRRTIHRIVTNEEGEEEDEEEGTDHHTRDQQDNTASSRLARPLVVEQEQESNHSHHQHYDFLRNNKNSSNRITEVNMMGNGSSSSSSSSSTVAAAAAVCGSTTTTNDLSKSETTYVCDPLPSWNKSVFEIQMTRRQETDNKITNNVSTTALQHHKDTRNIATSAAATSTTTTTTTITRRCDSFFFSGAVRAFILDWLCTILIGALVVSFWRGSWLLLDLYLCQQSQTASLVKGETFCLQSTISDTTRYQSAWISYLVGVMLLSVSLVAHSRRIWYVPTSNHLTVPKSIQRVCLVYMFGIASVLIWRGIWYASDLFFWPNKNNPALSYTVTMCLGFFGCFGIGCGASLLAPPSLFFLDGPGHSPPPIGLTILEAYYTVTLSKYTKMPPQTLWKRILDVLMSFMILPILVVWFWRGWWGLLDVILWGFTQERADLHRSLIWGSILALVMLFLGSNDAMYLLPKVNNKTCLSRIIGRLKSTILALATVSFWRVVWYVWDDLGGNGTTTWSAWLSHALGVIGLLAMGCFSCIAASPTTVGVDALTHDDALEEPLFHSVPIPSESIRFMAIAKKPGDFGGLATPTSRRDDGDQTMERVPSRRFQSTFLCFTTGTNQTMTLVDVCPDELCVSRRSLQKREHSIQFIRSR